MGRKRRDEDQVPEDSPGPRCRAATRPAERRAARRPPRRGRKLVLLLALAGAPTYLVRRNQRKAELDEGIWHEAPGPGPAHHLRRPGLDRPGLAVSWPAAPRRRVPRPGPPRTVAGP